MKTVLTTESNAIHRWMMKHVTGGKDDGQAYEVSPQALRMLRCVCDEVIKSSVLVPANIINKHKYENGRKVPHFTFAVIIRDASKARQLLPISEHEHSMRYDSHYLDGIKGMRAHIDQILRKSNFGKYPVMYMNVPEV